MQDLGFFDGIGDGAEDFGVPPLVDELDVVLAQQVEVVLVLCHHAVVDLQGLDEPVQYVAIPELHAIDQQKACVEVEVPVQSQTFLHVGAVFVHLHHGLLVACAEDEALYVDVEEIAHVTLDDGVAVDVDGLFILGVHVGDEEPEIGCLGVVVPERELVRYAFKILADVFEIDFEAGSFKQVLDLGAAFVGDVRVQEIDLVCVAASGVLP